MARKPKNTHEELEHEKIERENKRILDTDVFSYLDAPMLWDALSEHINGADWAKAYMETVWKENKSALESCTKQMERKKAELEQLEIELGDPEIKFFAIKKIETKIAKAKKEIEAIRMSQRVHQIILKSSSDGKSWNADQLMVDLWKMKGKLPVGRTGTKIAHNTRLHQLMAILSYEVDQLCKRKVNRRFKSTVETMEDLLLHRGLDGDEIKSRLLLHVLAHLNDRGDGNTYLNKKYLGTLVKNHVYDLLYRKGNKEALNRADVTLEDYEENESDPKKNVS